MIHSATLKIILFLLCVSWSFSKDAFAQATLQNISEISAEDREVEQAIKLGIEYLLSQQQANGEITDRQYDTTMTALSLMAMASTGVTPSTPGPQGKQAARALEFVLQENRMDDSGYFGNRDGSRMYGHGIVTLMLTEMLGMGADERQDILVHSRCQKAIDLILAAQAKDKPEIYAGGWRYTPSSRDSDLSVSVWQLMALRSAKNDGLDVPSEAIEKAVGYLSRSYTGKVNANRQPQNESQGFSYLPNNRNASFTMTAAGLLAMQVCGEYESPYVKNAARWLEEHPPEWDARFFFYGIYYYAQGMHQRGGEQARVAEKKVREVLLDRQRENGSWSAGGGEEGGAGRVYATSMAILSLSVKHHFLPIYQR